jgi:chemotaxis protein MotB
MKRFLGAMTAAALAGCVTQGTYDKLKSEHEATLKDLEAKTAQVNDYEKKTADQEGKLKEAQRTESDLRASLEDEQRRASDLSQRIAKLESDIASMVKDKSKLQSSVADMQSALGELQKRKEQAEARIAEYKSLLSKFRSLIDAGKLKVKIVDGRMVVVLATDVLFGSGSASLSKDGKAAISEVAQLLASIPRRTFQVEGHTDNRPIATSQYPSNWELASARALTVVKTMVEAGMPPERISAAAYGETRPAMSNDTPEGRSANRRIEITIVPDLSSLPGFDELQRADNGA